jgi:hypothetical protein
MHRDTRSFQLLVDLLEDRRTVAIVMGEADDGQWYWLADTTWEPGVTSLEIAQWATRRLCRALAAVPRAHGVIPADPPF